MTALKAGPKAAVTAEPLDFAGWPRDRAKRRERFVREFVVTPKGAGALKAFRLRPWQREIVRGAYAPGVRTALISLPRANGKTALAAALAVAELFCGQPSAEVLVVASDQRQANIALRMARRMIELNPSLRSGRRFTPTGSWFPRTTPRCSRCQPIPLRSTAGILRC